MRREREGVSRARIHEPALSEAEGYRQAVENTNSALSGMSVQRTRMMKTVGQISSPGRGDVL